MSANIQKEQWHHAKGGVIDVRMDAADRIAEIERMLGDLKGKAPGTLRNAVNAVARKSRTRLHQQAKKVYVSEELDYKSKLKLRKATISTLTARLRTSGERTALTKHEVSPMTLAHGKDRPLQYEARILQEKQPKVMKKGDLKSFVVQFASGHTALVQRHPTQEYEYPEKRIQKYGMGADLSRIVEKRSLSIAEMLGSEKVYGAVEPEIGSLLQQEIERFVQKTIDREAKKK